MKNRLKFNSKCFIVFMCIMMVVNICGINYKTMLNGYTVPSKKIDRTIKTVIDGSFQASYDDWFLENYSFRNYILKAYNQFKYSMFNKSANEKLVVQTDKSIIEKGYINSYLNIDITQSSYERGLTRIDEYVKNLKIIQDKLIELDKPIMYIIAPSKAEIYPEVIPYRFVANSQNDKYMTHHEILISTFEKYGINYYDSTDKMIELKEKGKYEPFSSTGIHWTFLDATYATEEILDKFNLIYNIDISKPNINGIEIYESPDENKNKIDLDIYDNLNIYVGKKDEYYTYPIISYDTKANYNLMRFGTSFDGQMSFALGYNTLFENQEYYYYLESRLDVNDSKQFFVENLYYDVNNIDFKELIENNDVFYIESVANNLSESHYTFVDSLAKYLKNMYSNTIISKEDEIMVTLECYNTKEIIAIPNEEIFRKINVSNDYEDVILDSYTEEHQFNISYHVTDKDGKMINANGVRTKLPTVLYPSDSLDLDLRIVAPSEPGEYIIEVTFVQEWVMWGDDYTDKLPIKIPMTVD